MITGIGLAFGSKNSLVDRYQPRPDQCEGWSMGHGNEAPDGTMRLSGVSPRSQKAAFRAGAHLTLEAVLMTRQAGARQTVSATATVAIVVAPAVAPLEGLQFPQQPLTSRQTARLLDPAALDRCHKAGFFSVISPIVAIVTYTLDRTCDKQAETAGSAVG